MQKIKSLFFMCALINVSLSGMEQQLIPRFATTHKDALLSSQSNDQDIRTYLSQSNIKTQNALKNSSLFGDMERAQLTENKSLTQAILDAIKNSDKLTIAKNKEPLENKISGNIIKIADLSKKIKFNESDKIAIASLKNSPLFQQENINILSQKPNWKRFQEACESLHSFIADFPIPQTIKSATAVINPEGNQPLFINKEKNKEQFEEDELLKRLQTDRFKKKINYNRIYFEGIARNIDMQTRLLEHDFSQDRLSLISKYKELLNFHAQRYIKLLAKNPNLSKEEKIASLKETFPQNNALLKGYLNAGLQDINIYEMKKKTEKLQKSSTQQTGQLASLEQKIKKLELIQEKENEKLDALTGALIIQRKSYEEEEKINLLRSIIDSQPEQELYVNPDLYTPNVFKELFLEIEEKEKNKEDATDLLNKLEDKAITYINYVVTNNEWETLGDKLAEIEKHLSPYTLFYLQKAAKYNKPLQKVIINEFESPEEKGFVEEFSFEEEPSNTPSENVIAKQLPEPYQIPITNPQSSASPLRQEIESQKPSSQEIALQKESMPQEPSAPGILATIGSALSQAATFVWEGINNFFNSAYHFFSGYIPK